MCVRTLGNIPKHTSQMGLKNSIANNTTDQITILILSTSCYDMMTPLTDMYM